MADHMTGSLDPLVTAIQEIEAAFPHVGWSVARECYRWGDERITKYWAEVVVDADRGMEYGSSGNSAPEALRNALEYARQCQEVVVA